MPSISERLLCGFIYVTVTIVALWMDSITAASRLHRSWAWLTWTLGGSLRTTVSAEPSRTLGSNSPSFTCSESEHKDSREGKFVILFETLFCWFFILWFCWGLRLYLNILTVDYSRTSFVWLMHQADARLLLILAGTKMRVELLRNKHLNCSLKLKKTPSKQLCKDLLNKKNILVRLKI